MSRTIRRKSGRRKLYIRYYWWCFYDYVRVESASQPGYYYYKKVPLDPNTKEYKKQRAKFHGDHGTHSCKEPGPSWWRNLVTERPQRRNAKREIQKWMNNPDYEPMILAKDPLEYWT